MAFVFGGWSFMEVFTFFASWFFWCWDGSDNWVASAFVGCRKFTFDGSANGF
jgi:hypothetical protein